MAENEVQLENRRAPYNVSTKQAFVFAASVITVLGSIAVAYISNPPDIKPSPELVALQRQYVKLSNEVDELSERLESNEALHVDTDLLLQRIQTDDTQCRERISRVESKVDRHLNTANSKITQYEIKFKELEILMNECLRRTGIR